MPELPEVETIRRQLAPHLEGRTIVEIEILDPRWTRPEPPHLVERALRGRTVERVSRSGKYLVWELSDDLYLLIHLRMTGALLFDPPVEPPHTRVRFELDAGHRLVYVDPRRFGTGHLLSGAAARDEYLGERLGIEPLTAEFTLERLREAARGRRAPVKSFLLDQRRIAGVGNIYADEALFRARIHPLRPAGTLNREQLEALRVAVEEALMRRDRGQGCLDRRLPARRRRPRVVPGPVPGPSPRGRAVSALRDQDPQAGRRRARHVRMRALPAAATGTASCLEALGGEQLSEPPGAVCRQQLIKARRSARRRSRSAGT